MTYLYIIGVCAAIFVSLVVIGLTVITEAINTIGKD